MDLLRTVFRIVQRLRIIGGWALLTDISLAHGKISIGTLPRSLERAREKTRPPHAPQPCIPRMS